MLAPPVLKMESKTTGGGDKVLEVGFTPLASLLVPESSL